MEQDLCIKLNNLNDYLKEDGVIKRVTRFSLIFWCFLEDLI